MTNETNVKDLTLAELHSWLTQARDIAAISDVGMAEDVRIIPDTEEDKPHIAEVETKFRECCKVLGEFDLLFHNKFDCR